MIPPDRTLSRLRRAAGRFLCRSCDPRRGADGSALAPLGGIVPPAEPPRALLDAIELRIAREEARARRRRLALAALAGFAAGAVAGALAAALLG